MANPSRWQDAPNAEYAIGLFDAGGSAELTADLRLSELVERYYKPVHLIARDARPRNVEEIEQTVKYWIAFTGDPPINAIDVWTNRDFVVGLKALPGRKSPAMGNNTIRKHCGAIQAILDLCGAPSRDNREGLGLLDQVPYIPRPPKEEKPAEDCYTLQELVRLIENAEAATLPREIGGRPIQPATYHRRIYGFNFNTGLRIGSIMGATWRHVHEDHLWLSPGTAVKGRAGKRIELNEAAREIILAMRGFDAERIFPWPHSWPTSRNNIYEQHDLIRQCLPEDRRKFLAFHALRKLHNNELAAINGLACMKSLGHTTGRTTVENYTSRRVVAAAVAQLPNVPINGARQQMLFG